MCKKIAIQGFSGCFHQIAAEQYFDQKITTLPCARFRQVIDAVSSGKADAGVLAIENSTAGSILQNYDLLQQSKLFITGEIYLEIRQHLITLPHTTLADIREVESHPMAIFQCKNFLNQYPRWELTVSKDTALSVKEIRDQKRTAVAAIASDLAAEIYGMKILRRDIHSEKNNYTRFLILNRKKKKRALKEDHKASLYFMVKDQPGKLAEVLNCIAAENINMSKVQSFPIPGAKWEYYFHLDLLFEQYHALEVVLENLKALTRELRILGIYKQGDTI